MLGGGPGVPERAKAIAEQLYPGVNIVGTYSPPFGPVTPHDVCSVVTRVNDSQPDFVWVGLGAPKQNHWVGLARPELSASAVLAVGAAFDFLAGTKSRAPVWISDAGLVALSFRI